MKRQTIKFDDIKNMLNEDEMRGVLGGSDAQYVYSNGSWGPPVDQHNGQTFSPPSIGGVSSSLGQQDSNLNNIANGNSGSGNYINGLINLPQGTYVNQGDGTFSYTPIPTTGPGPQPVVTVGQVTAAGISQDISFNNFGSYTNSYGGFAAVVSNTGTVGFSLNASGQWVASVNLALTPPAGFSHAQAAGNVSILLNGVAVGGFSINDTRDGSSQYYTAGTIPLSGNYVMPASFNGQGVVTFQINAGATENDGNQNFVSNSSGSTTLTLVKP